MKSLAVVLIFAASLFGESKTEKQLRAQVAELQDQLRKEQGLSAREKQIAGNVNVELARNAEALNRRIDTLTNQLTAVIADRESLRLQLKNHVEIDKFEKRAASKSDDKQPAAIIVKEVPRIEAKIDRHQVDNLKAIEGTANAAKLDMDRMERKIDEAARIARGAKVETESNTKKLERHDAGIDWIKTWGMFNSGLLTINILLSLWMYFKSR